VNIVECWLEEQRYKAINIVFKAIANKNLEKGYKKQDKLSKDSKMNNKSLRDKLKKL
jgi:hypothetical protein